MIYVDGKSIERFVFLSQVGDRSYYTLNRGDVHLAVLVCRNWVSLEELKGKHVDALIGWDDGTRGFVHDENVGRKHTKITIFRVLDTNRRVASLSRILKDAPEK